MYVNNIHESTTTSILDLGNADRITIGFSFGAADDYLEAGRFIPLGHICICLTSEGTLFSDQYCVFWNQHETPDGSISYTDWLGDNAYEEIFSIDFSRLPAGINELMFVVKFYYPEFSSHLVKLKSGDLTIQSEFRNINGKMQNKERVLVKIQKENGWFAKMCEEFCDVEALMGSSVERE